MTKANKPDYLDKVKQLSKIETERLLSRMGGKLDRRLEKGKLSQEEALAKQLELEDEQLQEWRRVMYSLKKKEEAKEAKNKAKASAPAKKAKAAEKVKATAKPKAAAKPKAVKPKSAAKPKAAAKLKAPAKPKAPAKKANVEPGK